MPTNPPPTHDPTCPFCAIAAVSPPSNSTLPTPSPSPSASSSSSSSSVPTSPTSPPYPPSPSEDPATTSHHQHHVLLSTPHILAFLDHAPMSRGHTLVCVRAHREKLSHVTVAEGGMLGKWLPLVSRAVMRGVQEVGNAVVGEDGTVGEVVGAVEEGSGGGGGGTGGEDDGAGKEDEDVDVDVGDWNVVQNNGPRAAQVVPHVHFHIIPRVGDVPEVKAMSWTMFGRGQREDLDEEEAGRLVRRIRGKLEGEVRRVRRREGRGVVMGLFAGSALEDKQGAGGGAGQGGEDWDGKWSKL